MRVSVIIVSRHRPALLRRALLALTQQDHPEIEVIVVTDPAGLAAAECFAVKRIAFDEPNISAARNLGIVSAAAEIVAFIDDDAVPEPTWASRLTAPFAHPGVIAATGFVRGRNGIGYQWRAAWIDRLGQDVPLPVEGPTLLAASEGRAVKTQGTNCAFRRDVLLAAGGFDPAFRFFHDETDLNMRLAGQGLTAILPEAEVHHGYAEGPYRRADRVPTTLHQIAASTAAFLRRHGAGATDEARAALVTQQRQRLERHLIAGRIEPRDLRRLMASLHEGWRDGVARPLPLPQPLRDRGLPFLPLPGTGPRPGLVLSGWRHQAAALHRQAAAAQEAGRIVTVLLLSPDARPHWAGFSAAGIWVQTGGLFGRSDRSGPRLRLWRKDRRIEAEILRICRFRPVK